MPDRLEERVRRDLSAVTTDAKADRAEAELKEVGAHKGIVLFH
jgi:hypothetical protein